MRFSRGSEDLSSIGPPSSDEGSGPGPDLVQGACVHRAGARDPCKCRARYRAPRDPTVAAVLGSHCPHARDAPCQCSSPRQCDVLTSFRTGTGRATPHPAASAWGPWQYFAAQQKGRHHSTRGSRVIPQRGTNPAQLCLTSEIGRDRVRSEWSDRGMSDAECGATV